MYCPLLHTQTAKHHGCNEFVHCCLPRPQTIMVHIASMANTRMSLSHSRHLQCYLEIRYIHVRPTLGARGLHAAHPDGRPKAGKTSGLHEANEVSEVLVASDLWFQPSFPSQNLTLELSQRCDSWSNQFYLCYT